MLYKKVCPIDSKVFYARKISTIYCSKKCSNRTRYLPSQLVEKLVASVSRYKFNEREYTKMASNDENIAENERINVSAKELEDLETYARVKKREQEAEQQRKSLESESGFVVKDEEEKNHENISGTSDKSS